MNSRLPYIIPIFEAAVLLFFFANVYALNTEHIKYSEFPDFSGKICHESHKVVTRSITSAMKCVQLCSSLQDEECKVASFETSTKTCHGCGTTDLAQMIEAVSVSFMRDEPTYYGYLVTGPDGIPDGKLSASSEWPDTTGSHGAERARLNRIRSSDGIGGWQPLTDDSSQYIEADFDRTRYIVGLVTQGRYDDGSIQYVKSYKSSFSLDCVIYNTMKNEQSVDLVFSGNSDSDTIVTNMLETPVLARCIRIHPVSYQFKICMRFDVLGF